MAVGIPWTLQKMFISGVGRAQGCDIRLLGAPRNYLLWPAGFIETASH